MKIRKGDEVLVLSGKDKGKRGRVIRVLERGEQVLVERINIVKRHTKPTQKDAAGGIKEKEAPLPVCKVMLWNGKANRPVRVGHKQTESDGKSVKVRFAHKINEALD